MQRHLSKQDTPSGKSPHKTDMTPITPLRRVAHPPFILAQPPLHTAEHPKESHCMLFWIIAALLATSVAAILAVPLLRKEDHGIGENPDLALYRDQLAEVDRDLARGILAPEDAERTRIEVSRRLLAADAETRGIATEAPRQTTLAVAGISGVVLILGGLALYDVLGAPGYPDIPLAQRIADSEAVRENRMSQAEAEALFSARPRPPIDVDEEYLRSIEQLRAAVPTRPEDLQGWQLLSEHEYNLRNYAAAARAQERVIELKGDGATTDDRIVLASQLVAATGGFVSPEAEDVLVRVLQDDPRNQAGRYYYGLLFYQTDRPDRAFRLFRDVVNDGTAADPFTQLARAVVEDAAFRTGVDYTLPPQNGPTLEQIAAADDLSPEDRSAMIDGMVAQLSDRLANEGGTAAEWARLITALSVLGDDGQARAILTEARQVFATSDDAMALIDQAATQAGLTE